MAGPKAKQPAKQAPNKPAKRAPKEAAKPAQQASARITLRVPTTPGQGSPAASVQGSPARPAQQAPAGPTAQEPADTATDVAQQLLMDAEAEAKAQDTHNDSGFDDVDDLEVDDLNVDYAKQLTSLIDLVDDDSFAENMKRLFGCAKIIGNQLSEDWRNVTEIGFANRDLKPHHVVKLEDSFANGLQRADPLG